MEHLKVSGNHIRMVRLDAEGSPVGEPIEIDGFTTLDISADSIEDTVIDLPTETITMDLTLGEVDPKVMALLFGEPVPFEVWTKRPPWWRILLNWWRGR